MEKFPITKSGYAKLEKEIKQLKTKERPAIIEAISTAREFGDLSENAEYHAAKEKQGFIEAKIRDLEDKFSRAEIIDVTKLANDNVKFGAKVQLIDDDTEEEVEYHIVGEYEADITKKRISTNSPLAKALIGKSVGDIAEVTTPKGSKIYEITGINFFEVDFN